MTPSQLDLADRLAEYLQDKWRPGMLHAAVGPDGELEDFQRVNDGDRVPEDRMPVLDDDCTKGALLGIVRRAWNNPGLYAALRPPYREGTTDGAVWRIVLVDGPGALPQVVYAPTEGEVLALALLAAP